MPNRLTYSEFVAKAVAKHGNKYGYDKVIYINSCTKVLITCPIHGVFKQTPNDHLDGCGCPACGRRNAKGVLGVGINDYEGVVRKNSITMLSYEKWRDMLKRCYNASALKKNPSYIGCEVCEEWKKFSVFKKWWDDNYVDGYELDKDILFKGNKVYSPDTCCLVPQEINKLLTKHNTGRGKYPLGVSKIGNRFCVHVNNGSENKYLGCYATPEEAFSIYKNSKEDYIKKVAEEYYSKNKITKRVYDALIQYTVDIKD